MKTKFKVGSAKTRDRGGAGVTWNKATRWTQWADFNIGMEVYMHSERESSGHYDFPRVWNTYLMFSDHTRFSRDNKLCDPYVEANPMVEYLWHHRNALDGLEEWNGGPTFAEFLTDQKGCRRIKIGDDYQHLWDIECRDLYDLEFMKLSVMKKAQQALELMVRVGIVVKDE